MCTLHIWSGMEPPHTGANRRQSTSLILHYPLSLQQQNLHPSLQHWCIHSNTEPGRAPHLLLSTEQTTDTSGVKKSWVPTAARAQTQSSPCLAVVSSSQKGLGLPVWTVYYHSGAWLCRDASVLGTERYMQGFRQLPPWNTYFWKDKCSCRGGKNKRAKLQKSPTS